MEILTVSKKLCSQFQTISAAIEAAQPGSKIIVEPGVYQESLVIEKDIELLGNSSTFDTVIESNELICIRLEADCATVSNLLIRGYGENNQYGLYIDQGSSKITNCHITSTNCSVGVMGEGVSPVFENCVLSDSDVGIVSYYRSAFTINNSRICRNREQGIKISDYANPTIRNTIINENKQGILLQNNSKSTLDHCTITHNEIGMMITTYAAPILNECTFSGNTKGISATSHAVCILHHCLITSNLEGILATDGSYLNVLDTKIKQNETFNYSIDSSTFETQNTDELVEISQDEVDTTNEVRSTQTINSNSSIPQESTDSLQTLLNELNSFIGLHQVKGKISDLIQLIEYTRERKAAGIHTNSSITYHSIFLGKPGTGKTSIARLLSKIFYALGILEKGHLVEVDRADLVGEYIGQTAQKTEQIIQSALGGVLFIDEAYTLAKPDTKNDFGKEAIELILKRMEGDKSFIVIAAGYPEEMQAFIDTNPGLKDRFTNYIYFEDYNPDELLQILTKMCREEEYTLSSESIDLLSQEFVEKYRKRNRSFGNARMIRKFFEEIKLSHAKRCMQLKEDEKTKEALTTIRLDDVQSILTKQHVDTVLIPINYKKLDELLAELHAMTGLEKVKQEVKEIVTLVQFYKEEAEDYSSKLIPHTVFVGNPGTGKTTVARLLSEIYAALGILPKGHLVEASREDLVSGYIGQTAIKTSKLIDEAMGGTLFIDEAYSLVKGVSSNDFGQEAIDTILKRMEDDRGKFILIVAGYTDEMKRFLLSNPGLSSRFGNEILFEDFSPNDLLKIAKQMIDKEKFKISDNSLAKLLDYFNMTYAERNPYFSNARFVRNLVDQAIRKATLRLAEMPAEQRDSCREVMINDFDMKFLT